VNFKAASKLLALHLAVIILGVALPLNFSLAESKHRSVSGQFLVKFKSSPHVSKAQMRSGLGVQRLRTSELTGAELVQSTSGNEFDHAYAKELLAAGLVEYIEPNYIVSINAIPNDSRFGELWGMHNSGQSSGTADVDIDAPEAWDYSVGSNQVVVGVIDTGINYQHPDLAANMWRNTGEIAGNGVDDDHNGVVDDIYGFNAINGSGNPMDDHAHGTHCAGTIGGTGNNGSGVAGVNWNVKLMALKFLSSSGSGTTQGAIDAINYAVRMKNAGVNIRVLNNSWGGGGYSQALQDAISAANNAGILFVAAAGNAANDNDASPNYPSNYDIANVISVAAIDRNGNLASFSNYGRNTVDIAAPGVSILSTVLGNSYSSYNGTSMATPHVSGIAALLSAYDPSLSVAALKSRILSTYKPLPTLAGATNSPGVASAYRAIRNLQSSNPAPTPSIIYGKKSIPINYSSSLGTRVLNADDGYSTVDLGFTFPYYGEEITRLAISANGRAIPLKAGEATPTQSDYSNALSAGINILHDDLYPAPPAINSQGGVWFKANGNVATITWVVVPYFYRTTNSTTPLMVAQLKVDSSGTVEFHYLDMHTGDAAYDNGASASIGLVAPNGSSGTKFTVSHNTNNPNDAGSGKALQFEVGATAKKNDFDGDGKSDVVVFRPGPALWYILRSSTNFAFEEQWIYQLGLPGDIPLTGDFDSDGVADMAVWRPSIGMWFFRKSSEEFATISAIQWGLYGDTPLTGDFDGDGTTDLTVYREKAGAFYVLKSSGGFDRSGALASAANAAISLSLGGPGNYPVTGDFNADGKDDFGVVWWLIRFWSVKNSSAQMLFSLPWGAPGDTPMACDWNGDKVADRVVVRLEPNLHLSWYTAATNSGEVYVESFGLFGDTPHCNKDYDGDGTSDMGVFRNPTGEWYVKYSSDKQVRRFNFGLPGDIPL